MAACPHAEIQVLREALPETWQGTLFMIEHMAGLVGIAYEIQYTSIILDISGVRLFCSALDKYLALPGNLQLLEYNSSDETSRGTQQHDDYLLQQYAYRCRRNLRNTRNECALCDHEFP